jgi:hypothetical protein
MSWDDVTDRLSALLASEFGLEMADSASIARMCIAFFRDEVLTSANTDIDECIIFLQLIQKALPRMKGRLESYTYSHIRSCITSLIIAIIDLESQIKQRPGRIWTGNEEIVIDSSIPSDGGENLFESRW